MIQYLEEIIGATYADSPTEFVLGFMMFVWLEYLLIQLVYNILGLNK